jgi:hypothetical protein
MALMVRIKACWAKAVSCESDGLAQRGFDPSEHKAKAEVAIQVATRLVIAKLRNRQFFSLSALNAASPSWSRRSTIGCRAI